MKVALQTISAQVSWGTIDWVQTHAPLEYCLVVKSMLGAHQEKIYLYYEQWKQYHINLVENEVL